MKLNRKKFLTLSSSALAAAFTARPGAAIQLFSDEKDELPLIDTHQHLWDILRFKEGWSSPPFGRNFDMNDYKAAIAGLNVVKAVYMEVAVPPASRNTEAHYAIEVCRDPSNPTVAAVIAGDPTERDFPAYIRQFEGSSYIKGIRHFFKTKENIVTPQVIENIRLLGELKMHFEFSVPVKWLDAVVRLKDSCPDTAFAVNHCGNIDPRLFFKKEELHDMPDHSLVEWETSMRALASNKDTICKISGVITRAPGYRLTPENLAPSVNLCLDIFGPDRVVFASDWPVCLKGMEIREWVKILKTIVSVRSREDQKKLFHDNAVRFYRL